MVCPQPPPPRLRRALRNATAGRQLRGLNGQSSASDKGWSPFVLRGARRRSPARLSFGEMVPKRLLLLSAVLLVVSLACRSMSTVTVTLGAAGPWRESYGAMNRRGIELAVEQLNARPERRDRPVRVLYRDDAGDGMRAAAVAQEFVENAAISAVIGHVNSSA